MHISKNTNAADITTSTSTPLYDLAILGGGPAGVAAGVYASRKRLKTVFITKDFQSQSTVSEGIENWIGTVKISGQDFAKSLEAHLRAYAGDIVTLRIGEYVMTVKQATEAENGYVITSKNGAGVEATYTARAILVTTGSHRRKLDPSIPGAEKFEHKGITYCASCDGPLFADQDVAVIGGGNAAFEAAAQLLAYCKSVTLLNRSAEFRADPITVKRVLAHPNMRTIIGGVTTAIEGGAFVESLSYENKITGEKGKLPVSGVFVEIGSVPTTEFVKDLVELDKYGHVVVDPRTQKAKPLVVANSVNGPAAEAGTDARASAGIWAAGDCTDGIYHQNNIAAGDAIKALEDIYVHLKTK